MECKPLCRRGLGVDDLIVSLQACNPASFAFSFPVAATRGVALLGAKHGGGQASRPPSMQPQQRWIGGVRALYWPSQGVPRGAFLFIPGNPGVSEYYAEFLTELHGLLRGRCVIVCKGSPGHDETRNAPPPTGRFTWAGHSSSYYGVPDQIASQRLALAELRAELPSDAPLVLAGHSMGAYVATQLLCTNADDVQGMQLLFPTISYIRKAPQARLTRLWMAPPLLWVAHWLVVCLACLPAYWHYLLVRALTMQPPVAAHVSSEFLRRPRAVYTALRTYADEEALITEIPDELRQVLQRRKIPVRAYWGRGNSVRMQHSQQDTWAPSWHRRHAESQLGLQTWSVPTYVHANERAHVTETDLPTLSSTECALGLPHAFCLRTSFTDEPRTQHVPRAHLRPLAGTGLWLVVEVAAHRHGRGAALDAATAVGILGRSACAQGRCTSRLTARSCCAQYVCFVRVRVAAVVPECTFDD